MAEKNEVKTWRFSRKGAKAQRKRQKGRQKNGGQEDGGKYGKMKKGR
jgi:hypothetical protein